MILFLLLLLFFSLSEIYIISNSFGYVVLQAVYGVESALTIVHRTKLHENIGLLHRKPFHQIMAHELNSTTYCSLYGYEITRIVFLSFSNWFLTVIILILSFAYVVFLKRYFHLHIK